MNRRGENYPPLRLSELVRELPMSAHVDGDESVAVSGVRHDSRRVQPGDLFVARPGQVTDGARFVKDAINRGAAAVMAAEGAVDREAAGVPVIVVGDPSAALAYAADAVYGHPSFSLDVIGITGTNGKTTTAHLVRAAIDGASGRTACGLFGTLGHYFDAWRVDADQTTPEADDIARGLADMRRLGASHAAMEVSSHGLELGRVRAVRFRVAAFTNLTQDHLDFHGTMDAYARAKARLFTELGPGAIVLNVDDPFGRQLARTPVAPLVRVSARVAAGPDEADVAPLALRIDARGIDATIRTPTCDVTITSRLIGAHNLENLLLALGIGHALDLDMVRCAGALSREPAPPGRLERCDGEEDAVIVVVDYAHTPDALARALEALRAIAAGRIWCVFGCGGDRDPTKRAPMGRAAARGADVIIVTTDNPRSEDPHAIADTVVSGVRSVGVEPRVELDRRKAIDLAVASAAARDIVLVAGKGHEDYQVVGDVKFAFDDRAESKRALAQRRALRRGA